MTITPTRPVRATACTIALLATISVLGACGIPEAKKVEVDSVHPDMARLTLKLVHIAAPRVKADDPASQRRLEEAVGVASAFLGLDAILFGGDVIANDSAATAPDSIEAFASMAGIIAARRYVILGERERSGALKREDVMRGLEAKKLVLDRSGTYGDAPKPGVRVFVIDVAGDGSVRPEARKAFEDGLKAAKEPLIVVAADQPPLDKAVQDLIRKDRRVKAVLFRAAIASVTDEPGEAVSIATPTIEQPEPVIRAIEIDGRVVHVRLLSLPDGAPKAEVTLELRPDTAEKTP